MIGEAIGGTKLSHKLLLTDIRLLKVVNLLKMTQLGWFITGSITDFVYKPFEALNKLSKDKDIFKSEKRALKYFSNKSIKKT